MTPDVLIDEGQNALVNFLRIDLELGLTYLHTASLEAASDRQHARAALEKARIVLETVRHFVPRVLNVEIRTEISSRANALEASIEGHSKPRLNT